MVTRRAAGVQSRTDQWQAWERIRASCNPPRPEAPGVLMGRASRLRICCFLLFFFLGGGAARGGWGGGGGWRGLALGLKFTAHVANLVPCPAIIHGECSRHASPAMVVRCIVFAVILYCTLYSESVRLCAPPARSIANNTRVFTSCFRKFRSGEAISGLLLDPAI